MAGVDHAGAEDVGDAQGLHALLAGAGDLHERQLALHGGALHREVAHPVHRHQAIELRLDLLEDLRRAGGHDGDAREALARIDLGDSEALDVVAAPGERSEEHTSELQSLMRISYAVFCLKKKKKHK